MFSRALPLALAAALISCSNDSRPAVHRIAILPAEVLTDSVPAGAGRVFAILLGSQLQGLSDMAPMTVNSHADAVARRATLELEATITQDGAELEAQVHERDPAGKTLRILTASADGMGPLAERIARQISSRARPASACTPEAIAALSEGMTAQGPQGIEPLTRAAKAAPGCGEAWLLLGNALASVGQAQQALMAWQSGMSPAAKVDDLARAQLRAQLASAAQTQDLPEAVLALAKMLPADAEWQARAGNVTTGLRRYPEAAQFYQNALKADPGAGPIWNEFANLQALQGDWEGALRSNDEYSRLQPDSPNAFDSRGEILFLARRFAEAAGAFEAAHAQDPGFLEGHTLRKAAEAHLLAGDEAAGRGAIDMWIEKMPADSPRRELTLAQWEHRTGRKQEALARLEPLAGKDAAALAQQAVWLTEAGERGRAAELARRAPGNFGLLLQFAAQSSESDAVWRARAQQAFPSPRQQVFRRLALTYALALDRKWDSVAGILHEDYAQMNPVRSGQLLAIYRRALRNAGQTAPADLPDRPSLPMIGPDSFFDCLAYGD